MGTVLIVDDHPESVDFLRQLLELDGRQVITANDGLEALECVKSNPIPCLIVLDLIMPRMNGWEFLENRT